MVRLLALLTWATPALAAGDPTVRFLTGTAPDPVKWLNGAAALLTAGGVEKAFLALAGSILFLGFIKRLYDCYLAQDATRLFPLMIQVVFLSVFISLSFDKNPVNTRYSGLSFEGLAKSAWQKTFEVSADRLSLSLPAKLVEARDAAAVSTTRLLAGAGLAVGAGFGVRLLAARAASNSVLVGGASQVAAMEGATGWNMTAPATGRVVRTVGGSLLQQAIKALGWVQMMVYPLMAAYSLGLMLSGLAIIVVTLLIPVGLALVVWGQHQLISGCFSVALTAVVTVLLLPPTLSIAIDQAFVKPMQQVQALTQPIQAQVAAGQAQTADVVAKLEAAGVKPTEDCINAMEADPSADPSALAACGEASQRGFWSGIQQTLTDIGKSAITAINDFGRSIINILLGVVATLLFTAIGIVIGVSLLFQLPGIIAGVIGGGIGSLGAAWRAAGIATLTRGRG